MALDWCKNVFFLNIFRTSGWILIKFCICIDKYKIHVFSNIHYFRQFLTELWPLIDVRILFMLIILWINLWISIKFCICIDIDMMQIWMIEQCFSFIFNRVMAHDRCWNLVYAQYLVDKLMDFDNCKCTDIDKMEVRTITNYFSLFFNGVMALDWYQNFVSV